MKSEYNSVMLCFVQGFEGSVLHQVDNEEASTKEANNNDVVKESRNRRYLLGIGRDSKRSSKKKGSDESKESLSEVLNEGSQLSQISESFNPKEVKRSISEKPGEITRKFGASIIRKTR